MNKIIIYVAIGFFALLVIGSVILSSGVLNGNTIKNSESLQNKQTNPELEKYRSKNIPEDCRLPDYESDIEEWKEHLSHHQNTLYCLDYFE